MSIVQLLLWEDKVCRRCGQLKTYNLFPPSKVNRDGLHCYCNQCMAERKRDHYKKNAVARREAERKYYHANADKALQYRITHREQRAMQHRAHQLLYPERHRTKANRYYARRRGAEGNYTTAEWVALCAYYDNQCLCCGLRKPLTIDHIVPLIQGGSNSIDNLQPLCRNCNSAKGGKMIDYRGLFKTQ